MFSPSGAANPGRDFARPSTLIRWHGSDKAGVIISTRASAFTFTEACERYRLSSEELTACRTAFDQGGVAALQVEDGAHKHARNSG
jgi:Protein of unknown function (DUF1153)